jgi:hypothetical protein
MEAIKDKRAALLQEQVEKVTAFSAIDEFMAVHQNNRTKGEVFSKL